ncbi:hypothetical protein K439DRAFT_1620603 [Ramaria rubella]|nr:hypothetical protein K439DRAFT_1620603 [Ramaria rubella]
MDGKLADGDAAGLAGAVAVMQGTEPNPALQPVSIVYSNDAPRYLDEPRLSLRPSYERSWVITVDALERKPASHHPSHPLLIPHSLPTPTPFLPPILRLRGCRTFVGKSVVGLQCFATYYINTKADLQANSIVLNENGSNFVK